MNLNTVRKNAAKDLFDFAEEFKMLIAAMQAFKRSDEGQKRRNLKVLMRARKRVEKIFMKDGKLQEHEKDLLILADKAIIDAMIKLSK